MDLQIKICSKKISHNTKSLYLYIRLKGCVFYERLNIVIRKEEEGTEDYYIKLKKAEDYRLCRFYELSNNPSDIKPTISLFAVCQRDIEKELHNRYKKYRIRGEWFKLRKKQIDEIIKEYNFCILENERI